MASDTSEKQFPGTTKRFVLLVAVLAMCAGGCATSHDSKRLDN